MKMRVFVTDDSGRVFVGEADLAPISEGAVPVASIPTSNGKAPKFELGERAFARAYGAGRSGPEIFALLVSYISRGVPSTEVRVKEVERLWGRMTSILGMPYNGKYPTVAKEYGWVNSPQRGTYVLTAEWQSCLGAVAVA